MSIEQLLRDLRECGKVIERGKEGERSNTSRKRFHADNVSGGGRERMSEREFVRSFGDKVKRVRWSQRADFVGLLVTGKFQGILITSDDSGARKVRLVDVDGDKMHVTKRYLRLKSDDSLSNLQRGLLRYVR